MAEPPFQDMQMLFSQHPLPMFVYDAETLRFLDVNEAATNNYGYAREEFLAMRITDIRPPEDVQRLLDSLGERDATWYRAGGWRHRYKSGRIVDVEITSHPVVFKGRRASLVIVQDVTDKKRLESQLRHAQKMDALGRLAGGVAHDFNNVLTAILGYSGLLLENSSDEQVRHGRLEQIHKAAERARWLTTHLLAFSRKQIIEPRILDINVLVEDAARMLMRLVGASVETIVRLGSGPSRVKADAGELVQVLTNLVVNARDAMPGGGRLTIETGNVKLDDAYARTQVGVTPGPYVMLAVSDSGIGMTPELQERLFEPFFTTKAAGKGTGLGLSTVYGIVRQRGGHVWVYSEPGRGSTFKIYLPRVPDHVTVEERPVQPGPVVHVDSATILIVEDDEEVRALVREALEGRGYEVLVAGSPDEARRIAAEYPATIHLLVTDVVMPGQTGPLLAEELKAVRPDLRVIYMSGFTDEAVVRDGTLPSGAAFLQKPFTLAELEQRVHALLEAPL
jgi:two-component system, cell cycle sensor histidine kinase and response regulator CckA